MDEVVRDYPLNVQWVGNRGTHSPKSKEPSPCSTSCSATILIVVPAIFSLKQRRRSDAQKAPAGPARAAIPDRIGGPIWGKLWVRSASASQLTTPSCPARNASGAVDSTSVWSSPEISMRRA